jgi:hypothetical protein
MTQRDRVLAQLKRRGHVYRTDFLLPTVIDGGSPILGVPQRIQELRDRGYPILTDTAANGTAIWRLPVVRGGVQFISTSPGSWDVAA